MCSSDEVFFWTLCRTTLMQNETCRQCEFLVYTRTELGRKTDKWGSLRQGECSVKLSKGKYLWRYQTTPVQFILLAKIKTRLGLVVRHSGCNYKVSVHIEGILTQMLVLSSSNADCLKLDFFVNSFIQSFNIRFL